jgi:hypothetical protein
LGWLSQGGWELHTYEDLTIFDEMTRFDLRITFTISMLSLLFALPLWLFVFDPQHRRKVKNADWITPVVWGVILLIAVFYLKTSAFLWMVGALAALLVVYRWRLRRIHKGLISIPENQYGSGSEAIYALELVWQGLVVIIAALLLTYDDLYDYATLMALIIPLFMWIGILTAGVPFAILWIRNWWKRYRTHSETEKERRWPT